MDIAISLVRAGVIGSDDFVEAISRQREERPALGQIAIEEGLLSVRQTLAILSEQRDRGGRFGELAIKRGLLTRQQVAELLLLQQERQRPVLDHLVDIGAISGAQRDMALASSVIGLRLSPDSGDGVVSTPGGPVDDGAHPAGSGARESEPSLA